MWQEGVLLRLVEPVDLVEEQDGARTVERQPLLRLGDRRADVGHTGHHRGHRREVRSDLTCKESREARLAGPGRTPQEQRREMTARDRPAEWAALPDEMLLAHELVEGPRPHPGGERLTLGRGLEERLGLRASGAWTCRRHRSQSRTPDGSLGLPELDPVALGIEGPCEPTDVCPQIRPTPVAWRTTHRANRNAMSEPPIMTIRRTSRCTYAYSWLARSAIEPLRTRTSPSTGRRERSRARAAFVSAARSAATICASSSAARASSVGVSETEPAVGVGVDSVVGRAVVVRRCSRGRCPGRLDPPRTRLAMVVGDPPDGRSKGGTSIGSPPAAEDSTAPSTAIRCVSAKDRLLDSRRPARRRTLTSTSTRPWPPTSGRSSSSSSSRSSSSSSWCCGSRAS